MAKTTKRRKKPAAKHAAKHAKRKRSTAHKRKRAPKHARKAASTAEVAHVPAARVAKRAAASPPKRKRRQKSGRRRFEIALEVPREINVDSRELEGLNTSQRLELAALGNRYKVGTQPCFVVDETAWQRALKLLRPHWAHYVYPYAAALWIYQRGLGGGVSLDSNAHRTPPRRPAAQA